MNRHARTSRGFTIVELLIVVVIIAILAAITLATYNGVQQRATNTAIIDAASKSYRMIIAYISANGTYPAATNACITTTTGCLWGTNTISTSTTFDTNIATVGTPPRSVPSSATTQKGIMYIYNSGRTMNGVTQPLILVYYLIGTNQSCSLSGITNSGGNTMLTSPYAYTGNDASTGTTSCAITIPGPTS